MYFKFFIVLFFLQMSVPAFAIINMSDCDVHTINIENVDKQSIVVSSELMDILKKFDWDKKYGNKKTELAEVTVEVFNLCKSFFNLGVVEAPKSWKNPSIVTAGSAKNLAIRFNSCLEINSK